MMMSTHPVGCEPPDLGVVVNLKSLPTHRYAHSPNTVLGYRKNGQPIFPIAGAEDQTPEEKAAADKAAADKAAADAAAAGKSATGEALDPETGKGLGFPAETPTERMTEGERTAYWRNQTKVQQKLADGRKDYDQQKADAEKWRAQQQSQMTPSEQAIAAAKLEAKKEAAVENADALVRGILASRGKAEVDINGLLEFVSPDRFVTADGKVDHQKVNAYANSVAPTSSSGGGNGYGQGRYEQTVQSRSAEGKAEAQRRFGTQK